MSCPNCGINTAASDKFCHGCGVALPTPAEPREHVPTFNFKRVGLLTAGAMLGVTALLVSLMPTDTESGASKANERLVQQQREDAQRKAQESFNRLTAVEHFTRARSLLRVDAPESEVTEGLRHLSAIDSKSPQRKQADALRAGFERKRAAARAEEERRRAQSEAKLMRDLRVRMASSMEEKMLDGGLNVNVRAIGKDQTTLRIEWILVSKVVAHQMSKQGDLFSNARQAGFKRVEITDGYNETWSWTLN